MIVDKDAFLQWAISNSIPCVFTLTYKIVLLHFKIETMQMRVLSCGSSIDWQKLLRVLNERLGASSKEEYPMMWAKGIMESWACTGTWRPWSKVWSQYHSKKPAFWIFSLVFLTSYMIFSKRSPKGYFDYPFSSWVTWGMWWITG